MTTDELRDWHARRAGWIQVESDFEGELMWSKGPHKQWDHPMPPTIDGAASAMPPNWSWQRSEGKWWAGQIGATRWKCVQIPETSITGEHEIHDRYLLAKLAWEQEHALAAACKDVGNG